MTSGVYILFKFLRGPVSGASNSSQYTPSPTLSRFSLGVHPTLSGYSQPHLAHFQDLAMLRDCNRFLESELARVRSELTRASTEHNTMKELPKALSGVRGQVDYLEHVNGGSLSSEAICDIQKSISYLDNQGNWKPRSLSSSPEQDNSNNNNSVKKLKKCRQPLPNVEKRKRVKGTSSSSSVTNLSDDEGSSKSLCLASQSLSLSPALVSETSCSPSPLPPQTLETSHSPPPSPPGTNQQMYEDDDANALVASSAWVKAKFEKLLF
ncbi:hypothetical protein BS17DRAFT_770260 [Gyrodon lividus]|nr:hypothetical protein BS17DRAFT_770260 [Gyrodon lividus]